jgi:hypothetical protein
MPDRDGPRFLSFLLDLAHPTTGRLSEVCLVKRLWWGKYGT